MKLLTTQIKTNWKFPVIFFSLFIIIALGMGVFITLRSNTGSKPQEISQQDTLQGMIIKIDLDPEPRMADEDRIVTIKTAEGKALNVLIPSGERVCESTEAQNKILTLQIGDTIEVTGELTGSNEITPCSSRNHYIKISKQAQAIDVSTWQTYRNEEFGFEVKYPSSYEIYEQDKKALQILPTGHRAMIHLSVVSPGDWLDSYVKSYLKGKPSLSVVKKYQIDVSGSSAIQLEVFNENAGFPSIETFIRNDDANSTTYNIIVAIKMEDKNEPPFRNKELDRILQQTYDQILSTFRFVE